MHNFVRFSLLVLAAVSMAYAADTVTCAKGYYNNGGKCVPKNVGNNDDKTATPSGNTGGSKTPGRGPVVEGQSTAINTSRSNVKNNIQVLPGPDGKVRCTSSASGAIAACSASEVAQLNTAIGTHFIHTKGGAPAGSVTSITQAKDGSLMCTTASGTVPCTAAHVADLNQGAGAISTKGIDGK